MALQLAALPQEDQQEDPQAQGACGLLDDKLIMLDSLNFLHANGSVKHARIFIDMPKDIWIPFNTLSPRQQSEILAVQLETPT